MKLLITFGSLLYASLALAGHSPLKRKALKNAKFVIEKRFPNKPFSDPEIQKRAISYGFLSNKTEPFSVNGTGIPEVPFDIGESYAGLLPISDNPKETRKLFFWFFPSTLSQTPEEIVIWLNGGPGCSSLLGLLTENGPFTWEDGTLAPVQNSYSWTNLTNVLWVEQPVGVGYSQGVPNITNEVELANEFRDFYKQFINLFSLHNWKTYITGESYAGYYAFYIADSFITANDTAYFNIAGVSVNDPLIGRDSIQEQIVALPFVEYWQNLMFLNDSFMGAAIKRNKECGYSDYYDTYMRFPPPKGPFPVLPSPDTSNTTCDLQGNFLDALFELNPCFNIYHITDTCPTTEGHLDDVDPEYTPHGAEIYFNRTDVKLALHANINSNWEECTEGVFNNGNATSDAGDGSADAGPANDGTLRRVIESTNNTIIGCGGLDMLLSTNGTLLALQNVTWNGAQGFSRRPSIPLYVPYHDEYNFGSLAGAGIQGFWTQERGLTFYTARYAGHELPRYTPGVAYRMLEILLGRVENFSSTKDFTTQSGNFTGNGTLN